MAIASFKLHFWQYLYRMKTCAMLLNIVSVVKKSGQLFRSPKFCWMYILAKKKQAFKLCFSQYKNLSNAGKFTVNVKIWDTCLGVTNVGCPKCQLNFLCNCFTKKDKSLKLYVFFLKIYSQRHLGHLKRCPDVFIFTVIFKAMDKLLYC